MKITAALQRLLAAATRDLSEPPTPKTREKKTMANEIKALRESANELLDKALQMRSQVEHLAREREILSEQMPWWRQELKQFAFRIADRMRDGQEKHGNRQPLLGEKDYVSALVRHWDAYCAGETDEDHLAAVAANAMILAVQERYEFVHEHRYIGRASASALSLARARVLACDPNETADNICTSHSAAQCVSEQGGEGDESVQSGKN